MDTTKIKKERLAAIESVKDLTCQKVRILRQRIKDLMPRIEELHDTIQFAAQHGLAVDKYLSGYKGDLIHFDHEVLCLSNELITTGDRSCYYIDHKGDVYYSSYCSKNDSEGYKQFDEIFGVREKPLQKEEYNLQTYNILSQILKELGVWEQKVYTDIDTQVALKQKELANI